LLVSSRLATLIAAYPLVSDQLAVVIEGHHITAEQIGRARDAAQLN
jgi:hypothetical protein